jgi:hypothetical protein
MHCIFRHLWPPSTMFLWFQAFSLKVECSVSATKLFNKSPLAILNGTSNAIGLHNEHSLFQKNIDTSSLRCESKHLASLLTTDKQRERQAGCVAVSFRLDYLYIILPVLIISCCQLPFCEFPKHTTALHYRYDMQIYCTFLLFVNQHVLGLPASGTHCI